MKMREYAANKGPKQLVLGVKRFLKKSLTAEGRHRQKAIRDFVKDSENTFLVSFPRTGSHWLRMIMELYFQRPQLTLTFYFKDSEDYFILHTHDMAFQVERQNVIYLYREPVATIYSQMRYHEEPLEDPRRIEYWTTYYAKHLAKWLHEEEFTKKKTLIDYDRLKANMHEEFSKVTTHFGMSLNPEKLDRCLEKVSKENLKEKTQHDRKVVNLHRSYQENRERFREQYTDYIWKILLKDRPFLWGQFGYGSYGKPEK